MFYVLSKLMLTNFGSVFPLHWHALLRSSLGFFAETFESQFSSLAHVFRESSKWIFLQRNECLQLSYYTLCEIFSPIFNSYAQPKAVFPLAISFYRWEVFLRTRNRYVGSLFIHRKSFGCWVSSQYENFFSSIFKFYQKKNISCNFALAWA